MKNPANSNIYEANAVSVLEAYGAFIEGTPDAMLLVLSTGDVTAEARAALTSSAERLGFKRTTAWVQLGEPPALGTQDVFAIVEGLDPVALVALDAESVRLLGEAYRCEVPLDAHDRVFGRNAAAFNDFAAMLQDSGTKQKAWSLLKRLA